MDKTLNYHHLRYFREVAIEGNLGRAAARLNVAQSALSVQIRQLEARLGFDLFDRVGRALHLTEAGRIALDYADRIFNAGDELVATLRQGGPASQVLRVGALSTLSRNFQMRFLTPVIAQARYPLSLKSSDAATLLDDLAKLSLDVVLTTEVPAARDGVHFAAKRIAEQPVHLHAVPERLDYGSLAELLAHEPLILPTEPVIRAACESLFTVHNVAPNIAASVDDMAMLRLLARTGLGVAVSPSIVVADELASGVLKAAPFALNIHEPFYAVTLPRDFPHPALRDLLA